MSTSRRHFLMGSALAAAQRPAVAQSKRPVISKLTLLDVPGDYFRPVAMNAYDTKAVGKTGHIKLARVFLSDGTMGLTVQGYVQIKEPAIAFVKQLLGVSPEDVFRWEGERIAGFGPKYDAAMRAPENNWLE